MLLNHISRYGVLPAGGLITPTPTLTINASPTPTRTTTPTLSISPSLTRSPSPTVTMTPTPTFTNTPTTTKLLLEGKDESKNYNTPTPSPAVCGGDSPTYYSRWQMPTDLYTTYMDSSPRSGGLGFGPWRILRFDDRIGSAFIEQVPSPRFTINRSSLGQGVLEVYREFSKPINTLNNPNYSAYFKFRMYASGGGLTQGQSVGMNFYDKNFNFKFQIALIYYGPYERRGTLSLPDRDWAFSRQLDFSVTLTPTTYYIQDNIVTTITYFGLANTSNCKYFSIFNQNGNGGTNISLSNLEICCNPNGSF